MINSSWYDTGLSPKRIARMTHTTLGHYGEALACKILEGAGWVCSNQNALPSRLRFGDIRAKNKWGTGFDIEVKIARPHYRHGNPRWHFCLKKEHRTDVYRAMYAMLIALDANRAYTYLVPSSYLNGNIFSLTSHPEKYRGYVYPWLINNPFDFGDTMAVEQILLRGIPF